MAVAELSGEKRALHCCPHLGLAGDPASHCLYATDSHLCFRWPPPKPVARSHQTAFCLSDDYRDCFRLVSPEDPSFRKARAAARTSRLPRFGRLGRVAAWLALVLAMVLIVGVAVGRWLGLAVLMTLW